jgi:hypothetical protein
MQSTLAIVIAGFGNKNTFAILHEYIFLAICQPKL